MPLNLAMFNATQLSILRLANNHLTGPIPESLSSLTNLELLNIAGNDGLLSLDGLENLISASGIIIGVDIQTDVFVDFPNPNLTDFCALENLFINGTLDKQV